MLKLRRSVIVGLLIVTGAVFISVPSHAIVATQAVAQGYNTNSPLQPGMIVRLDTSNSSYVSALDLAHVQNMLGVVVPSSEAAVTLGYSGNTKQVFVTNFGRHDVLVSNENGPISVGQYITISSVAGIGMAADDNEPVILGQAAANFNGKSGTVGTTTIGTGSQQRQVDLGLIPVDIAVANNPLAQGPKGMPKFLKKVTQFATNKSVSASRVYLSLTIVVIGALIAVTVIYASVKNGIISLGRNPLAKRSIGFNLIKLVGSGLCIFALSLGVAYAILL